MNDDNTRALAQLICFNPLGATFSAAEEAFITQNEIGSFVLFGRNLADAEATSALVARIHELVERPLIAVDQEGGRVIRLPGRATHLPSAMAIGAANSAELAYRAGEATGRELRASRMNVALAPVLDVNDNPANPVIGTRSFGEQANVVTAMGTAWLRGAQDAGIAACAKHFPGHGDTQVDSHAGLPRIEKTRAELERVELAPFRAAVAAGVAMVMPGHLLLPALDAERPSSLSRKIVTDLLRTGMGFAGVTITDALDMDAVRAEYGIPRASVEAVWAGCDLVVPVVAHEETLAALQRALDDGYLSLAEAEKSVERIHALRERIGDTSTADPSWLGAKEHQAVAVEIAERAIRVTDADGVLPINDLNGYAVLEFALGKATVAEMGAYDSGKVLTAFRERVPGLKGMALAFDPSVSELRDAHTLAHGARGLIVVTRQALHFAAQQAFVRECLTLGKPTVLIAMRDPYDLGLFPMCRCTIAAFDDSAAMVNEVVRRVTGS